MMNLGFNNHRFFHSFLSTVSIRIIVLFLLVLTNLFIPSAPINVELEALKGSLILVYLPLVFVLHLIFRLNIKLLILNIILDVFVLYYCDDVLRIFLG